MDSQFANFIKGISDELIAMTTLLEHKMETWAKVFARHPDSQNIGIAAGFISNQTAINRIELLIDIQAPPEAMQGILRTRAIETARDAKGNERFNAISMEYEVDRIHAQQLVEKDGSITRTDIKQLLHTEATKLKSLVISDETGRDSKTQQLLGKRYDLEPTELATLSEASNEELIKALDNVLARLKQAAADEAK